MLVLSAGAGSPARRSPTIGHHRARHPGDRASRRACGVDRGDPVAWLRARRRDARAAGRRLPHRSGAVAGDRRSERHRALRRRLHAAQAGVRRPRHRGDRRRPERRDRGTAAHLWLPDRSRIELAAGSAGDPPELTRRSSMKLWRYLFLPREISAFERSYLRRMNRIALIFFYFHVPAFIGVAALAHTSMLQAAVMTPLVL